MSPLARCAGEIEVPGEMYWMETKPQHPRTTWLAGSYRRALTLLVVAGVRRLVGLRVQKTG